VIGIVAPTTFGLIPIGGNDVFLHTALGVLLVWAGFMAKEDASPATMPA
jgi:hypothetical protein